MATAYNSKQIAAGVIPKLNHFGITTQIASFTIAVAFVINDTVNMVNLQGDTGIPVNNGPLVNYVILDVPSLDSSTGIVTAVGDSGSAGRYISGATVGRSGAGGIQTNNVAGSIGYAPFAALYNTYTTPSLQNYAIVFKVTTAATGTAATTGTITLKVDYTADA